MPFSLILFFLSAGGIFLSNVFVGQNTSQLGFFLVLSMPFFLFLSAKIEKKKIYIPVKETIFYLLFVIFSVIASFQAIDKEVAIQSLLIYAAGYLFFVFCFNYQEKLKKYLKWFLIGISIFSAFIFFANKIFTLRLFEEVSSIFYGGYYHNEIGNLLILGIIVCLYNILFKNKYKFLILLLFFLPFFFFSYSRSAYLSIMIVGTIFLSLKKNWLLIGLIILITGLFFATTNEINRFFPKTIKNFIENKLLLPKEKSFTGKRQQHFYYSLLTIKERPIFGVGPDNLYLSTVKKQFNLEEGTTTAHDIFLDLFAENGALAGISFLIFLVFILKKSKKDLYFYLFLSLTFIFLFNFSYRYNSMFLIWMILAGTSFTLNQKDLEVNNIAFFLPMTVVFVFGQIILSGVFFDSIGQPELSLKIYPLNQRVYREIIEAKIRKNKTKSALEYLEMYNSFFKDGYIADNNKAILYEKLNDKKKSIYFYKKAIYDKPISISTNLDKIIVLYVDLYGESLGKIEAEKFVNQFKKDIGNHINSDVGKIIKNYCYDYKLKCQ